MALTKDVLIANAALATLTPEQISAIETLSVNDESTVIGSKIGELHGRYDTDVMEVVGIPKNQGEKSYDYVKRVLGSLKTKAESVGTIQTELNALKTEKATLEQKLRDGAADATIKQKLVDTETRLQQLQSTFETEKSTFTQKEQELNNKIKSVHVDYAFNMATQGLKFKQSIPDSVINVLLNNAKAEVLAEATPDFIEENGKQTLVFRDKNNQILNNPENKLNPFTVGELISNKLKDVLDTGRKVAGGGTNPPKGDGDGGNVIDISSAKNQVEADDLIAKHLLSLGHLRQSPTFAKEQLKLRAELKVDKLPMR